MSVTTAAGDTTLAATAGEVTASAAGGLLTAAVNGPGSTRVGRGHTSPGREGGKRRNV